MSVQKILEYVNSFVNKDTKTVWFHIVLIYLIVFGIGLILLKPVADGNIRHLAKQELAVIEDTFDRLQRKLQYLTDDDVSSLACPETTTMLRREVFNSDVAKEIGVFRPSGEIYCTSNDLGNSFYLYQTIMDRLEDSGVTLSFTKGKLNDERSVILLFVGESKHGVSVVIPPRYIRRLVIPSEHVIVELEVISRSIQESDSEAEFISTFEQDSQRYPLSIKLHTSSSFYFHYYLSHTWIGFIIASFASIGYVRSRQRKLSGSTLEYALRNAIKIGEIEAYYQPIVDSRTGEILGCESLVRWNSPSQGMISPVIFIPLAEKLGLIDNITEIVLDGVVKLIENKSPLFEGRYISINISRSQILLSSFVDRTVSYLKSHPGIAEKLVFEITEESVFAPDELTLLKRHLKRISACGVRVAVDDFGTGYSGLDFIRQYPFDFIKIDRVFVTSLGRESTTIPILESIAMLAKTFDMTVIVEGAEEARQVNILSDLGFSHIQGFYYYKPMPEHELIKVLSHIDQNRTSSQSHELKCFDQ